MKKVIALILALSMLFAFAACSAKTEAPAEPEVEEETVDPDVGQPAEPGEEVHDPDAGQPAEPGEEEQPPVETPALDTEGGTMGEALLAHFEGLINSGTFEPQALAEGMLECDAIEFDGGAMEVEPGFLTGFTAEIDGFESGYVFMPMIGTIPFVGYVFELADPAAAIDFLAVLDENADMRWNVCTEADEKVSTIAGSTVLFIMCSNQ